MVDNDKLTFSVRRRPSYWAFLEHSRTNSLRVTNFLLSDLGGALSCRVMQLIPFSVGTEAQHRQGI